MTIKTEYAELQAERERVAKRKLPAVERAAWAWRKKVEPVDHFVWRDPFANAPAITETEEAFR